MQKQDEEESDSDYLPPLAGDPSSDGEEEAKQVSQEDQEQKQR
jgi:hypothetical protein